MKKGLDILLFVCIQLWITKDSHSLDPLCRYRNEDKTVNICTDHSMSRTSKVIIDTASVPKFQQMFCECIITPFQPETHFIILLSTDENDVHIKIDNTVVQATFYRIHTLSAETTLYFSSAENYTRGACIFVRALDDVSRFNITCSHPTTLVIDTTPLASSRATTTEISNFNITTSLAQANTVTKNISGNVNVKTSTTETIQKRNITSVKTDIPYKGNNTLAQDRSKGSNSEKKSTEIVVLAVIGFLLIAAVLILAYARRRQFANNTKMHEPDPCMSSSEQGLEQQNNPDNEEGNLDILVNTHERLNIYVNDTLAGEMYRQLYADNTKENLEINDVVTDSRNQNRNVTKQVKQEGQLKGQAKGEGNNSNGEDRDTEIAANAYEKLNIYVNDNLAGRMYEQLNDNQDISSNKDIPVKINYHGTKQKRQAFAVYANAP